MSNLTQGYDVCVCKLHDNILTYKSCALEFAFGDLIQTFNC